MHAIMAPTTRTPPASDLATVSKKSESRVVHVLAVVERNGMSNAATGHVLTGSWLWDSSPSSRTPGVVVVACLGATRCVLTNVAALLSGLRANADANRLSVVRANVRELWWRDRL